MAKELLGAKKFSSDWRRPLTVDIPVTPLPPVERITRETENWLQFVAYLEGHFEKHGLVLPADLPARAELFYRIAVRKIPPARAASFTADEFHRVSEKFSIGILAAVSTLHDSAAGPIH